MASASVILSDELNTNNELATQTAINYAANYAAAATAQSPTHLSTSYGYGVYSNSNSDLSNSINYANIGAFNYDCAHQNSNAINCDEDGNGGGDNNSGIANNNNIFANHLDNTNNPYQSIAAATTNNINFIGNAAIDSNSYLDGGFDGVNYKTINNDPNFVQTNFDVDAKNYDEMANTQYLQYDNSGGGNGGNGQSTDTIPISKHVEITKNDPYPVLKQIHVPGEFPFYPCIIHFR